MTDKEKAEARFGFVEPDECVMVSQCTDCLNNKGKKCDAYGDKPLYYARAILGNVCPRRAPTRK